VLHIFNSCKLGILFLCVAVLGLNTGTHLVGKTLEPCPQPRNCFIFCIGLRNLEEI
jgi:hypothetical protein